MITTKQKWTLGGLVALSAAVWTPQILARMADDSTASVVPDGPTATEIAEMESEFAPGDPAPGGPEVADPRIREGSTPEPVARSTTSETVVGPEVLLASIATALGNGRTFGAPVQDAAATARLGARDVATVDSRNRSDADAADAAHVASPLDVFLERNALGGTFVGASRSFAIFGPHRVHVGEHLPGTGASLVAVRRTAVTLAEEGVERDVELPPLRTSVDRMNAARPVFPELDPSWRTSGSVFDGDSPVDLDPPTDAPAPSPVSPGAGEDR